MQCFQEQGYPTTDFQQVEIRDDGLYSSKCSKEHTTLTVIQEQKFELLFDTGAMALIDGYPREAVTTIAASLERFYEFYIATTCLKHGIELEKFQSTWKHVANQSERQFGAYLFIYLIDHNNANPPVIDNDKPSFDGIPKRDIKNWKEFRNAVVHKGYIPTSIETIAYGNLVYLHLYQLIEDLKDRSEEALNKVLFHHLARAEKAADGKVISTMSIPTLVSIKRGNDAPKSFEEALKVITAYRNLYI